MNKKLMAIAVAGALAAPGLVVAQVGGSPGVSLYGRLDTAILNNKYAQTPNYSPTAGVGSFSKGDVFSAGNEMGVRGREDLGGGTSAWFQLATGVWPDGRLEGGATNGQHFGGRNSGVGMTSSLGDIMWGIWDTPYKLNMGASNVVSSGPFSSAGIIIGNGDSTGALPNALCTNTVSNSTGTVTTAANGVCVTESTGNTTAWSRRVNNSVQYWSPVFAGLQFRLATALANYQSAPGALGAAAAGTQKPKLYSGSLNWTRGPIVIGAAYEVHGAFRIGTAANQNVNTQDKALSIGGKFDFGIGQVGVGYERLSYDNTAAPTALSTKMDVPSYVVNGRINAGPGAVWAGYTKTNGGTGCQAPTTFNPTTGANNLTVGSAACSSGTGSAGAAKMYSLGYDYVLSKRTKLYLAYAKIDNGISTSYYYVAGPSANGTGNGVGGLATGTDVTTYGLGMQHSF